ncbi:S8 family serine peptidase [Nocardioides coralli]|uniref:S8 family serine peptidase n=1 Tax=Nocardioides coralli TaxID=2872154 RepID=UPI001CA407CF|nr:S8 family serine peptidase [Nocardioides coralli]QZY30172.1 S8 family serine peptidase [Nocardioides coralli]
MLRTITRRLTASVAVLATAAAMAVPATTGASAQPPSAPASSVPTDGDGLGKVIVAFDGGGIPTGTLAALQALGVERAIPLRTIGAIAVTAPLRVIDRLDTVPGVAAVEPQRRLDTQLYESKKQIKAVGVDKPQRYTTRAGKKRVRGTRPGVTGKGVTVAVLDSGIFAGHPDFGDRVVKGLNFSYSEVNQQAGFSTEQWDTYAESTGPVALQDEIGHGTHVAGTIGGDGSLSASQGGPDLAGVAPGVELISMRVATPGFGIVDDIDWEEAALAAFDWTIRHRKEYGIDITQNSWGLLPTEPNCFGLDCGEPTDFDAMSEMIASVVDSGVHVVFSAGNNGPEPGTIGGYHDPRNGAILVGAACKTKDSSRCDEGQEMTDFSSRGAQDGSGPQVDVVAPGDTIMAALSPSVLAPLTECPEIQTPGYFCISGTSMSSPHVAGVVALMLEANPRATPRQVKSCLRATAVDMMDRGFDIHSGMGMVHTKKALRCIHALTLLKKR